MNPLKQLETFGQSVWLDFVSRPLLAGGELKTLIERDGLKGMTSNPSIFEKSIGGGHDYDAALNQLERGADHAVSDLYEALVIEDIRHAADALRPVYDATGGIDGYISLEVSPYLANDTEGTVAEARRLWKTVDRRNLMVKVPATPAGVPAIRALIGDGMNINVTLLFSQAAYAAVADAYLDGLEALRKAGGDVSKVASVASFFVSRIDTAVDALLQQHADAEHSPVRKAAAARLMGKTAIANAKLAYQHYLDLKASSRWQALAQAGAKPQRLLWASTGTKNKAYRDTLYVEELIGLETVNTMPPATMDAFRDHGEPRRSLDEDVEGARRALAEIGEFGVSIDQVTTKLVADGVQLFADAFDQLMGAVEQRRQDFLGAKLNRQTLALPKELQQKVDAELEDWRKQGKIRRLWRHDAKLWTGADEANWLGWLTIADQGLTHLDALQQFQEEVRQGGFGHILLLGMGGSSLGPEVFEQTFGRQDGFPEMLVLDSTDPAQIKRFEARIDLAKTLFIVSSKSGGTLEPNIFKQYFYSRAKEVLGDQVGRHFVAVTDPGSKMQEVAERDGFRHIFYGDKTIGGRYSVLSNFGLVPAAAMGVDLRSFLEATLRMARSCDDASPPSVNPGVRLGATLGALGKGGRDKVTVFASPGIGDFGAWLEQLVAESTGKLGKGLVPVDGEPLGAPDLYGADRVFAYLRLETAPDAEQDRMIDALAAAGQPVVRIAVTAKEQLGQEFFRWELAVAAAGAILGIDPFDQPDVEASKIKTRELTTAYEQSGSLPPEQPIFDDRGITLFTDARNAEALGGGGAEKTLDGTVKAHFARLKPGDYAGLIAYLDRTPAHIAALTGWRRAIRDAHKVATVVGFGPRFLHSTGQAYKGGPNTGVFLQITSDDAEDLAVPDQKYTFGVVKAAQARGDFDVLADRGRRLLRIHLGADVEAGLARLTAAINAALA